MKSTGSVDSLFIKPGKGYPMAVPHSSRLNLRARYGIAGDVNANSISPRQILLTSLETLNGFGLKPGDLRENLVLRNFDVDTLSSGTLLQIGTSAIVRLTFHCEPCKQILPLLDVSLKAIVERRGFLGVVLRDGVVCPGDEVKFLSNQYCAIPDLPRDRFLWIVKQIPHGKVATYSQLLSLLGVSHSYARAIPTYLKYAKRADYPLHRILDSKGALISQYVSDQQLLLENEGVVVANATVDVPCHAWEAQDLYYR